MNTIDIVRREQISLLDLTEKQRKFAERYIIHYDKFLAFHEAGYGHPENWLAGTNQKNMWSKNVDRVLEHEKVAAYIDILKKHIAARLDITVDRLILELKAMATARMSDYIKWNSNGVTFLKDSDELTDLQRAGVMEITDVANQRGGHTVKIKLHPKQPAIDRLLEILNDLEKQQSVKTPRTMSNQQYLNILQNPAGRRALEFLAAMAFGYNISLRGKDKGEDFQRRLDQTLKNVEAVSEPGREVAGMGGLAEGRGAGGPGCIDLPGVDRGGDIQLQPQNSDKDFETGRHSGESEREEIEDGEPDRYDIDGL